MFNKIQLSVARRYAGLAPMTTLCSCCKNPTCRNWYGVSIDRSHNIFGRMLPGEGPPDLVNAMSGLQKHRRNRELHYPNSVTLPQCSTSLEQNLWLMKTSLKTSLHKYLFNAGNICVLAPDP